MSLDPYEKSRRVLSREKGTILKKGARYRVVLVYPNTYRVGMASLGFQRVYDLFNELDDVSCERCFLPYLGRESRSLRRIKSLESLTPLNEFDLIAFSVSYERDFINIPRVLDLARMDLVADHRSSSHPLVTAGGICSFLNPEPITRFIDFFLLGEFEPVIKELYQVLLRFHHKGSPKDIILERLSEVDGIYVPSLITPLYHHDGRINGWSSSSGRGPRLKRRYFSGFKRHPSTNVILTPDAEFGDTFLVEMNRGCGLKCRFCVADRVYCPPRFSEVDPILSRILHFRHRGIKVNRVGLLGCALSEHPFLLKVCHEVLRSGLKMNLASIRIDRVPEDVIRYIAMAGQMTLSIAPDVGSKSLMRVVNKVTDMEKMLSRITLAVKEGIRDIKVYFLIGVPMEGEEDLKDIVNMALAIRDVLLDVPARSKGKVILSINPLIPKPWTPFQWHPMEEERSLKGKFRYLRRALSDKSNMTLKFESPRLSVLQGFLSLSDRSGGDVILRAYKRGGDWRGAFRELEMNPGYFVHRERGRDELFPWDFIDQGVDREKLLRDYQRALASGK